MSLLTYESDTVDYDPGEPNETAIPAIARQTVENLRIHGHVSVNVVEDSDDKYDAIIWPEVGSVYFRVIARNGNGTTEVSYGHMESGSYVRDGYTSNTHTQFTLCRGFVTIANGGAAWQLGIPGYYNAPGSPSSFHFALISCIKIQPQLSGGLVCAARVESPETTIPYPRISFRGDAPYQHLVRIGGAYKGVKFWDLQESQYNMPDNNILLYPTPIYTDAHLGEWGSPTIGGSPVYYMSGRQMHGIGSMVEFKVGESRFVSLGRCCIHS